MRVLLESIARRADAMILTGKQWRYLKVPQKHFEQFQPAMLADLMVLRG